MKKHAISLLSLVVLAIFAASCQMGVSSDMMTGLSYNYNGLGVDEVFLSVDGQRYNSDEFGNQSQVYMNFLGVNGFEQEDGKVFPGLSVRVTDPEGNVVLESDDLLPQYSTSGLEIAQAGEFSSNLTIGNPMEVGQTYTWAVRLWDKKGEGTIEAEMDFTVN